MSWQDRIKKPSYTSPSGSKFEFSFENANRSFEKNTTAFSFPGVEGTYIQDLGSSDRKFPMRIIFWGSDHDLEATKFENALKESGRGKLEHPHAGLVDVVPFGTIKIREDLVTAANQTIFEVSFWESSAVLYPSGSTDSKSEINTSVATLLSASENTFVENIDSTSAIKLVSIRNKLVTSLGSVRKIINTVISGDPKAFREFNIIGDGISKDINELISKPVILAAQFNQMTQVLSTAEVPFSKKLAGYSNVISQFTSLGNVDDRVRATANDFRNDEFIAVGALAGLISSASDNTFSTRVDAVLSASEITTQFDVVESWRELNYRGVAA